MPPAGSKGTAPGRKGRSGGEAPLKLNAFFVLSHAMALNYVIELFYGH